MCPIGCFHSCDTFKRIKKTVEEEISKSLLTLKDQFSGIYYNIYRFVYCKYYQYNVFIYLACKFNSQIF